MLSLACLLMCGPRFGSATLRSSSCLLHSFDEKTSMAAGFHITSQPHAHHAPHFARHTHTHATHTHTHTGTHTNTQTHKHTSKVPSPTSLQQTFLFKHEPSAAKRILDLKLIHVVCAILFDLLRMCLRGAVGESS